MNNQQEPKGNIYISHRAIASIVYHAALESYGLVGLASKNLAAGLANVLVKDSMKGVDIQFDGQSVEIDLYIIIEYGTRITSVAESVADNVRYQVENLTGMTVKNVNVHVRGLRISNP